MIKVSNIKKLPPILTIDLKFLFKIQIELFVRKTSPRAFVFIFFLFKFRKKYLCLFDISNAGYKEKDRVENTWKEIND